MDSLTKNTGGQSPLLQVNHNLNINLLLMDDNGIMPSTTPSYLPNKRFNYSQTLFQHHQQSKRKQHKLNNWLRIKSIRLTPQNGAYGNIPRDQTYTIHTFFNVPF